MPLSFKNVTYSEVLALEDLEEEKCFQELLEQRGRLVKAQVNLVL